MPGCVETRLACDTTVKSVGKVGRNAVEHVKIQSQIELHHVTRMAVRRQPRTAWGTIVSQFGLGLFRARRLYSSFCQGNAIGVPACHQRCPTPSLSTWCRLATPIGHSRRTRIPRARRPRRGTAWHTYRRCQTQCESKRWLLLASKPSGYDGVAHLCSTSAAVNIWTREENRGKKEVQRG